jgi:hypothetical protein
MSNPNQPFQELWNYCSTLRHHGLSFGMVEVERRLSVVEELEAEAFANLQRASGLRQSILHKAFTGELV